MKTVYTLEEADQLISCLSFLIKSIAAFKPIHEAMELRLNNLAPIEFDNLIISFGNLTEQMLPLLKAVKAAKEEHQKS